MCIIVTSRGKEYTFPSGMTRSRIDLFLKDYFADGIMINTKAHICLNEKLIDGSYFVLDYITFGPKYWEDFFLLKDREQELRDGYRCRQRALDEANFWSIFEKTYAHANSKQQKLSEKRRVCFDPMSNVTFVYSPNSCPMEAPHRFNAFCEPNREYFDIPAYRGVRVTGERKRKACLLNDAEGGRVVVSRRAVDSFPSIASTEHAVVNHVHNNYFLLIFYG